MERASSGPGHVPARPGWPRVARRLAYTPSWGDLMSRLPKSGRTRVRRAQPPEFDRVNCFYGQMLGVRDFQVEQEFFHEKAKLHNRALHGHGVVCGLEVEHHAGDGSDRANPDVC